MKAIYYGSELWQSSDYDQNKYGIPELKKYPMPDREHVKSAIRFFNYVSPKYEKELAAAIIKRIHEYHMTDISVGPDNRFGKYWNDNSLTHCGYYGIDPYDPYTTAKQHGVIGQKWGVWNEETRARYLGLRKRKRSGDEVSRTTGSIGSKSNRNAKGETGDFVTSKGIRLPRKQNSKEYENTIKEIEDDAKVINGGLMAAMFAENRDNNCAYCTTAYELRRRGYDVKAAESIVGVDLFSHPDLMFKGAKANLLVDVTDYKKDKEGNYILDKNGNKELSFSAQLMPKGISKQQFNEIEKELVKQGEGARGNIFGMFAGSAFAGHSMAYEIVNGKLCIIDAQVGTVHDGSSILKSPYQDLKDFREVYYTRTDNLAINEKLIDNFVVDASAKSKVDAAKVAKTALSMASFFIPGAGLAYYAVDAADNISKYNERKDAVDNAKKRGY